jgi:hypothetical protein
MQQSNMVRAGILATVLTIISLASWEFYLRHRYPDLNISYDDNSALWANKRAMVYEPKERTTVFIGPSRIKFGLDIPTWETETGNHAVQLALIGQSDWDSFDDLANDIDFKGKLIVDVVEQIFFIREAGDGDRVRANIAYYRTITPTQRASFQINHVLESGFIFLNQDNFSINALLSKWNLPKRKNVLMGSGLPAFPVEFTPVSFDRQSYMTPNFVKDTNLQNEVKKIWVGGGGGGPWIPPTLNEDSLQVIFKSAKADADKIRSRGGEVLFVRTPTSGPFEEADRKVCPRKVCWDRLLAITGCPGIYYKDYPAIAHFVCPEWGHLSPEQAAIFTKNLVKILREEKGWTFPKKPA